MNNEPRTTNLVSRDTLHASRNTSFKLRDTLHEIRDTNYKLPKPPIQPSLSKNYDLFMQNKPNLPEGKIDAKCVFTKDYENKSNWTLGENKPNSNPIKPNPPPFQSINLFSPARTARRSSIGSTGRLSAAD